MDIWISRIKAPEVYQMRYALDANHCYRSGQSRLPDRQWRVWSSPDFMDEGGPSLRQVWPEERTQSFGSVATGGAEYFYTKIHDAGRDQYGEGSVTTPSAPVNIRFYTDDGCGSGQLRARSQLFSRGGHAVISWANAVTWGGGGCWQRLLDGMPHLIGMLNAGESLGSVLMAGGQQQHPHWSPEYMYWGDLTLGPKRAPGNLPPVISAFSRSSGTVRVGEPVTFTVAYTDPDGTGAKSPFVPFRHRVEWFLTGYDGRRDPVATTDSTQSGHTGRIHTYTSPHTHTARVEVMDEWRLRSWQDQTVVVLPDPAQPLRVDCGDTRSDWGDPSLRTWLHDQNHVAGGWGWVWDWIVDTRTVAGAIAGTDLDPVYQTARTTTGSLTYRIPVANGTYTVVLGFADILNSAAGRSRTDVAIEGVLVLDGFDAFAAAGGAATAVDRSFTVAVADGELTVVLSRDAASLGSRVFLNALQVLPAAGAGPSDARVTPRVTATAGQTATFQAAAEGSPTPAFQWQRLVAGTWTDLPGATGTTLTWTATTADDGALVRVRAANAGGSLLSTIGVLTVLPASGGGNQPPTITVVAPGASLVLP